MSLDSAIQHLLAAKRISNVSQSYAKDNPGEWAKVKAYLTGGARPTGVVTEMGVGLIEVEDARRGVTPPPPPPPPPSGDWPASYFTGPAGQANILPSRKGVFVGTAQTGSNESVEAQISALESYMGRKIDIEHRFMQAELLDVPLINAIIQRGRIPMVSWFPNPSNGGQILRGDADNFIRQVGQQIAAQPHKFFLRMFWEFNGDWYPYSRDIDGSLLTSEEHKAMWRRVTDILRANGAFPKASLVWCPGEGHFHNGDAMNEDVAYPGDTYVDWVGSDGYNFYPGWCGYIYGWCEYQNIVSTGQHTGVEEHFRGKKPYMIAETSSREDSADANRKGNWWRNARDYIKATASGTNGFVVFDVNYGDGDWRIATSEQSKQGFRDLALDPYFKTR